MAFNDKASEGNDYHLFDARPWTEEFKREARQAARVIHLVIEDKEGREEILGALGLLRVTGWENQPCIHCDGSTFRPEPVTR